MRVPFAFVGAENESLLPEFLKKLERQLREGSFIGGEEVAEFERRFAALHHARFAVAVNSGTDALRFALRLLGLLPGATVITVSNTFVATVGAVISEGFHPLLVDVDEDENMAPEALEQGITPETRAVIAVHLRGWPAQIEAIREICDRRGLQLIEDCAQAVAATAAGRPVGTFGRVGCFSLHPLKNLGTAGDGGVLITDDAALADEARLLRNHGLADRDTVRRWGENSRLDALQAGLLNVKLDRLDAWTARRVELAELYHSQLAGLPLVLPPLSGASTHVYHRFSVRTPHREALRSYLHSEGVETAIHYPVPIHRQPAAQDGSLTVAGSGLPRTEEQCGQILSLPLHPLLSDRQAHHVADHVNRFWADPRPGAVSTTNTKEA